MNTQLKDFIYPTEAAPEGEWLVNMLEEWRKSGKKHLCFPFFKFKPHTLPEAGAFWMFMYYRKNKTPDDHLRGIVKFRIRVLATSGESVDSPDVHTQDFGGDETIWFLCNRAEEIIGADGSPLTIDDFEHRDGKVLTSTIRSSIAPLARVGANLRILASYP